MPDSGVTAGSYGPSADATPGYGATFSVPYLTVDAKGRVTAAFTKTITIPASDNTDEKVKQTVSTDNKEYPILTKDSNGTTTTTAESKFAAAVTVNPSTGNLTATKFTGDGTGINIGSTANKPVVTTTSGKLTTGSFGTAANTFCEGNDSRLSDARTPTSHTHGNITNDGKVGSDANKPLITTTGGSVTTGSFGTAANTFCEGNDSRLSDARTPTSHTHGNITNDGKVGTTSGLPLITTTGGAVTTGTFGTSAGTFCEGNDSRLSDARTPTSHTHGNLTNDGKLGTASAVVVTDSDKKILASTSITTTELGYLDGVTSAIQTQLNGKAASSHEHAATDITSGTLDAARIPNLDAAKITSGTISIERLPAGALERLVVVADQTARFALTTSDVQLGDTVKQTDTGVMYYVKDVSHLDSAAGYEEYSAGTATSVPWSGVTNTPTTLSGYDIGDASISNGVITLGSSTITPLTAGSSLDASKLTGTASVDTTGNAGTATALATARYIDGVSFDGSADIVHYGTCSTAGNTAAKTVACTGYALKTGGRILVRFNNTNTATSPTLSVNSTTAKAIYVNGAAIEPYRLQGGTIYEFIYNGTQYDLVDGKTTAKYTTSDPGTTVPTDLAEGGILIYSS